MNLTGYNTFLKTGLASFFYKTRYNQSSNTRYNEFLKTRYNEF